MSIKKNLLIIRVYPTTTNIKYLNHSLNKVIKTREKNFGQENYCKTEMKLKDSVISEYWNLDISM